MIHKPIYKPSGKALEYGDLAINIYTGCNHRCVYCFAPGVLRRDREKFHTHVEPRADIVESVRQQLEREQITDKLIHLCFTCDPYPAEVDTTPTREIIRLIKDSGNHVQILTKGGLRAERDFDLLDGNDWFGVTYTGLLNGMGCKNDEEPNAAADSERFWFLAQAHKREIKTWVSFEPILDIRGIIHMIEYFNYIDHFKFGKLNYHKPEDFGLEPINWREVGREIERLCVENGRDYYIKDSLRKEMEGDAC